MLTITHTKSGSISTIPIILKKDFYSSVIQYYKKLNLGIDIAYFYDLYSPMLIIVKIIVINKE